MTYEKALHVFQSAILEGLPQPALAIIRNNLQLDAGKQLNIYIEGYRIRLFNAVKADYPALRHAMGEAEFDQLAKAYIEATPSFQFNLDRYSIAFADFLPHHTDDRFMLELATLEKAMTEVFLLEESEPLEGVTLACLTAEQFGEQILTSRRASRLLAFAYPVNTYLTAFRADQAPSKPFREAHYLYLYRHQNQIVRQELPLPAFALLQQLFQGRPVREALENALSQETDAAELVIENLQSWFHEWTAAGFFSRIDFCK
ncbi:MAG: putative DNA-binding domain-containing protein [Pseudomonadota bacterium]|nr:putative DNA-binding domain-containing protein [Pseudomonadota bacterium]